MTKYDKKEGCWEFLSHAVIVLGAVGCYASIFTLQIDYSSWIKVMTNLPDVQSVINTSNSFDNTTVASVVIVCPRYSAYLYAAFPPNHTLITLFILI